MPITKQHKEEILKGLTDDLGKAKSIVVSSFSEVTVNTDQALRSELRAAKVNYRVIKKTLLKKALEAAKLDSMDLENIRGNVAVASAGDEISAAKVLHKFAKDNDSASVIGGYLESVLIDEAKVSSLAKLPSKEELIAKALATINAPIQNFVGVLSGVSRKLVYALNAIKESKS